MKYISNIVNCTVNVIGYVNKRRRINLSKNLNIVKVNLGCGLTVAPGWINIDGSLNCIVSFLPDVFKYIAYKYSGANNYYSLREYVEILKNNKFIHYNLEYGIPLPDESVNYIYMSHFLEHINKENGKLLLDEIYRTLKPGGIVRLVVPDLSIAILLYIKGEKKRMLDDFFFLEGSGKEYSSHKYMYDYEMLQELLKRSGFTKVVNTGYREGKTPDIKTLDNQPEISIYVEANKPLHTM